MNFSTMSDEQFAEAAKAEPWAAIEYANDRLSDEQFAEAAKAEPWAAIEYAKDRYQDLKTRGVL